MRAEAMTAYTRSLLEPLLVLVQQQGTTIREQAETIGRQAAELDGLATAHSPGASDRTPWVLAALAGVGVVLLFVALVVVLLYHRRDDLPTPPPQALSRLQQAPERP